MAGNAHSDPAFLHFAVWCEREYLYGTCPFLWSSLDHHDGDCLLLMDSRVRARKRRHPENDGRRSFVLHYDLLPDVRGDCYRLVGGELCQDRNTVKYSLEWKRESVDSDGCLGRFGQRNLAARGYFTNVLLVETQKIYTDKSLSYSNRWRSDFSRDWLDRKFDIGRD